MATTNDTTVVMDLETPRTFQDVGGHHNLHLLGISVCGVYFYETDEYRAFRVEELPEFEQYLREKRPLVVGFNHLHFDFPVLQPYLSNVDLSTLPAVDILHEIYQSEGIRLKLETVAQGTLLEGKSGDGLDAVRYYRQGDWDKLIHYCLDDVRLTKDLYDYGKAHGRLYYYSAGASQAIPVPWGDDPTVEDVLENAWKHHQQVELCYRQIDHNGRIHDHATIADLRSMNHGQVQFYCHATHEEKTLDLRFVLRVGALASTAVHQAMLF